MLFEGLQHAVLLHMLADLPVHQQPAAGFDVLGEIGHFRLRLEHPQDPFSVDSVNSMRFTVPRTLMSGTSLSLRRSSFRCGLASWRTQLTGRSMTWVSPSLPQWATTN